MKAKIIFVLSLVCTVSFMVTSLGNAAMYTLASGGDAMVANYEDPDKNYGAENDMKAMRLVGVTKAYSYIKFDLSSIPASEPIVQATLYMYCSSNTSGAILDLFHVDDDSWVESTITWNNSPVYGVKLAEATITFAAYNTWNLFELNAWNAAADHSDGFVSLFFAQQLNGNSALLTKENPNFPPYLVINTGTVVPIPGAVWLLGSGLLGLAGWRRFRKS